MDIAEADVTNSRIRSKSTELRKCEEVVLDKKAHICVARWCNG